MGKLDNATFKRYKELKAKKDRTPEENAELLMLEAKRAEGGGNRASRRSNGKRNDIRHYLPDGVMSKDIADLPFGKLEGTALAAVSHGTSFIYPQSVMAVVFHTVADTDVSETNATTQAARILYTWVRHQNSGHTNYDAPDLGIYVLASNECTKMAKYLKRLIKMLNTYYQDSRALPTQLFQSLGISVADFDAWINDLPSFRGRVNHFIRKLSQLSFPADVSLYAVQGFLIDNLFKDTSSIRTSYILFEPGSWMKYSPTDWATGGSLRREEFKLSDYTASNGKSLLDLMDYFEGFLNVIVGDDDMNIMSGDILKAYRNTNMEDKLYKFTEVSEYDTVEFNEDSNVLKRLHNATICGSTLSFGDIIQSPTGVIHSLIGGKKSNVGTVSATNHVQSLIPAAYQTAIATNPLTVWGAYYIGATDQIGLFENLVYDDDEIPSSDNLVERTRFMVAPVSGVKSLTPLGGTGTVYGIEVIAHGTEIIDHINVVKGSSTYIVDSNLVSSYSNNVVEGLTTFKYYPVLFIYTPWGSGQLPAYKDNCAGWNDVQTTLSNSQLQLMNKIILFHEFAVDAATKVIEKK